MSLQPLHYSTHAAALFKNAAPFLAERWPDYDRFEQGRRASSDYSA